MSQLSWQLDCPAVKVKLSFHLLLKLQEMGQLRLSCWPHGRRASGVRARAACSRAQTQEAQAVALPLDCDDQGHGNVTSPSHAADGLPFFSNLNQTCGRILLLGLGLGLTGTAGSNRTLLLVSSCTVSESCTFAAHSDMSTVRNSASKLGGERLKTLSAQGCPERRIEAVA